MPMQSLMRMPSLFMRSMIAFEPKAVASTRARKIIGAVVPSVMPAIAPFSVWSASGVRRPFIQSTAITPLSPIAIFSASAVSAGRILSQALSSSSIVSFSPRIAFIGNSSTRRNQA